MGLQAWIRRGVLRAAGPLLRAGLGLSVATVLMGTAAGQVAPAADTANIQAYDAVMRGDFAAAIGFARQSLAANPKDAVAHLVITVASLRQSDLPAARRAARKAFRFAQSDQQKFQAAMVAADIAERQGRGIDLRYWLGRAADAAPSATHRRASLRALHDVREDAFIRSRFSFSLSPSSNVNNGSSSPYNIIDGLPLWGVISPEARALSGWELDLRASGDIRLTEFGRWQVAATGDLALHRVALDGKSKRAAPALSGADLADTTLMLGLEARNTAADGRAATRIGVEFGRGWPGSGSDRILIGAGLDQTRQISDTAAISYGLSVDIADPVGGVASETRRATLFFGATRALATGGRLFGDVSLTDTWAGPGLDRTQREARGVTLRLGYQHARPVGPFSIGGAIGFSRMDYADFRILTIPVPGGRQDQIAFGEITLGLDKVSVMGFEPTFTLRSMNADSNVSAYSRTSTSLGMGWRMKF